MLPYFQDDFYLNLVDWSSQNILSVGLGTCVYLWSAFTSQVITKFKCRFNKSKLFYQPFAVFSFFILYAPWDLSHVASLR